MLTLATGPATSLGLIAAIGAQNAWVLRQGIRRQHIGVIVALCIASDMALISVGTLGMGALVTSAPWVITAFTWAGAAYLCWFAWRSFRSALRPQSDDALTGQGPDAGALRPIVGTTLALTWLNPHVYLDTMVMLGGLANQHPGLTRWAFAGGAMLGSALWFAALGLGARALSRPLSKPSVWRVIDAAIGVMMLAIAARLLLG
ncbi:amino acid transporter [Propionibacterium freudenreichii]|uniref:LysE/ArgO family amino acid transporter n=1 Tax=Propionibacterium freudenreichii TaxID=1744 RepID=UPI002550D37D|nr:LysE/ArgO family amino acid transporter [Propionibacterium freudenreichii]MDK9332745.1 amino acid transporter [Propionibacterium freudenreichii]MDK9332844.1 amino acid transporter [Propionibacterium freudenreichii]